VTAASPSAPKTFRGLPHAFWVLIFGMFVNRVGAFVLPYLALYLQTQRNLGATESGLIVGAWGVGAVIAALVGGQLADRWGRKRTMLLSLCGGAVVLAGLSQARGFGQLAALALALGAVAELYRPAVSAAVTDLAAPELRSRAFSYLIWSYNLGFAVSPLIAGVIAEELGFGWLFVGDAATMLAAAIVLAVWTAETRPAAARTERKDSGFGEALRDRNLRPMLLAALMMGVAIVQIIATFGPLMSADGIDLKTYGRILALNGLLVALTQPWVVPLSEKFGASRVVPLCALVFCGGLALHAFVDSALAHAFVVVVWTAGEVALFPLCNTLVANIAPTPLRGRYQGLYFVAWSTANVIGPPLGQELYARFGAGGWSALPLSCAVVAAAALFVATRRAAAVKAAV
jgi:MFS family permease